MTHVMVDIETLGTKPGSTILSIGACRFDPNKGILSDNYYLGISRKSCAENGFTEDPRTLDWWQEQSDEARELAFSGYFSIKDALADFADYWDNSPAEFIWCHGAAFDVPLLEAGYELIGMKVPWNFWNVRCTRTIYHLAGVSPDRTKGTHHNALDDAIAQAEAVCRAVNLLRSPL